MGKGQRGPASDRLAFQHSDGPTRSGHLRVRLPRFPAGWTGNFHVSIFVFGKLGFERTMPLIEFYSAAISALLHTPLGQLHEQVRKFTCFCHSLGKRINTAEKTEPCWKNGLLWGTTEGTDEVGGGASKGGRGANERGGKWGG